MKPEAQRIAIAEACGWSVWENHGGAGGYGATDPEGNSEHYICGTPAGAILANVPDYLNDLNAMHAAVSAQDKQFKAGFTNWLYPTAAAKGIFQCELTAQDWADAFLRCIGKWVE